MDNSPENIPEWLKTQEQNSWQIELLISGGMIFTLWQLPDYFTFKLEEVFINTTFTTSYGILFIGAIMLSRALLIGFGVNLLLRTLWLAFLGIHYAYPKGIDYKRLNYSDYYSEKFSQENNAIDRILKVEKYCSLSFSLAIFFAVSNIGVLLIGYILFAFFLEKILPSTWADDPNTGYVITFFFAFVSYGFLDRVIFGWLKKKTKLQKWYYPISKIYSYFSFFWLFNYEWKTLLSNIKRWKIHLVTLSYLFLAFIISLNDYGMTEFFSISINSKPLDKREFRSLLINSQMQNDEYDEHLTENMLIREASIPAEIIGTSILPFFVTYDKYFDESFSFLFKEKGIIKDWKEIKTQDDITNNTERFKEVLGMCLEVEIDSNKVENLKWYFRKHPITKQLGFHTKIDIDTFSRGEHILEARFIESEDALNSDTSYIRKIPFWKE